MNTPVIAKLRIMKNALLSLAPIVTLALAGCAVGPNYQRPTTDTPAHYKADQAAAQDRAVANSRRAAELASERYRAGIVSYLEVVDADRVALQSERVSAQLAGQQLIASVHLIKALGGRWQGQGF